MVEHDPIVLAKQVASLDQLSGGRVVFGVGAGWNHEEMRQIELFAKHIIPAFR